MNTAVKTRLRDWSEHNPETGCREWTHPLSHGYGQITYKRRTQTAHRWAWEMARGPVAEGLYVCHKCDNPKCVNVDHLFVGTPKDNMQDAIRKGRIKPAKISLARTRRSVTDWSRVLGDVIQCLKGREV